MTNTGEPGDEDELDHMMGSMRGMFRELADEEPPARGLDALMAAARTKAAALAPEPEQESWRRRTLAMLTRPPMLAAATVIVLVGSTVVLTRRGGLETATEHTSSRDEGERSRQATAPTGADRKFKDNAAPVGAGRVEVREGTKGENSEKAGGKLDGGGAVDRPVTQRPRPPANPRPAPPTEVAPEPVKVERPTVEPVDEVEPKIVTEGGLTLDQQGRDKAPEAQKPATSDTVTAARPQPETSVMQLVKQAESAAGRKDCAAVKATAERIRKLDEAAYKTRVLTQPAIKPCL